MSVKDLQSGLGSMSNNLRGIGGSKAALIIPQSFYLIEFTCKDCGHKQETMFSCLSDFMPYSLEYFAFKFWWENFKKCPECGKKNWNVRIRKKHTWGFPMA